jgi:phage terminase large subunit
MAAGTARVVIDYAPRAQFRDFHNRSQRFACIVAHRRAGKTVACVQDLQRAALRCRLVRPRYAYIAPFRGQAKTVAWDYLTHAAGPLLAYGASIQISELRVDYPNEGQVRLYGADNADSLRGIYLDGVVCDEYADMDPRLWSEVLRPALSDRAGWAVFIGTPRGRNDFYKIHRRAIENPEWFSLVLKASETGLISPEELASARHDLSEDQYEQEFECSFDAAVTGTYFGKLMAEAERDGRITGVPRDGAVQVWTAWDLGVRDSTAIWFAQMCGREIHLIDYYENSQQDLGHYVSVLGQKGYAYQGHILPHDVRVRELITGKSRLEVLGLLGLKNIVIAPEHRVEDGINGVRVILPRCWFDKVKCERGIDCLKLYRSMYDEKLKIFSTHPLHDYCSHAADAMRYLAMGFDQRVIRGDFSRTIKYPKEGVA